MGSLLVGALLALAPTPFAFGKELFHWSFTPAPEGAASATVWAGTRTTMTLVLPEWVTPLGPVKASFTEEPAEGEPATVVATAHQVSDRTWQAVVTLPRPGTWSVGVVFRGTVAWSGYASAYHLPPFALQALPSEPASADLGDCSSSLRLFAC